MFIWKSTLTKIIITVNSYLNAPLTNLIKIRISIGNRYGFIQPPTEVGLTTK
jgi:hypothetical protein